MADDKTISFDPTLQETASPPPLVRIIEALLFVGGPPLSAERACEHIRGLTPEQFNQTAAPAFRVALMIATSAGLLAGGVVSQSRMGFIATLAGAGFNQVNGLANQRGRQESLCLLVVTMPLGDLSITMIRGICPSGGTVQSP